MREFAPVAEAAPARAAELAEQAIVSVEARRYELAEEQARMAIAIDPNCARARAALGAALANRASLTHPAPLAVQNQADGETAWAFRRSPNDPVVVRLRARFLATTGHVTAAAEISEAWLSTAQVPLDRDGVAILSMASEWRYELGEERAAQQLLRQLITASPHDEIAHFRYGYCRLRTAVTADDALAAAAAFARCAELAPGDVDAHRSVGCAQFLAADLARKAGDDAAATKHLELAGGTLLAAAETFTADGEAMFQLGVVREAQGDRAGAIWAWSEAIQRTPQHVGALLNLAALRMAPPADPAGVESGRELLRRALAVPASTGGLTPAERTAVEAQLGTVKN